MEWLIQEMIGCLLFAAGLGVVIGYVLGSNNSDA